MQLAKKSSSDIAHADDDQSEAFAHFKEGLVDDVERAILVSRVHHTRNIPLGSALSDGGDIDVVPAQSAEHFAGDTGTTFHLVAHHGDDGLVRPFIERGQAML